MITLIRRARRLAAADKFIEAQQNLINGQHQLIRQMRLDHVREMQGITCAWLISMERPEVDLREEVAAMERVLGNQVASLEEHIL